MADEVPVELIDIALDAHEHQARAHEISDEEQIKQEMKDIGRHYEQANAKEKDVIRRYAHALLERVGGNVGGNVSTHDNRLRQSFTPSNEPFFKSLNIPFFKDIQPTQMSRRQRRKARHQKKDEDIPRGSSPQGSSPQGSAPQVEENDHENKLREKAKDIHDKSAGKRKSELESIIKRISQEVEA